MSWLHLLPRGKTSCGWILAKWSYFFFLLMQIASMSIFSVFWIQCKLDLSTFFISSVNWTCLPFHLPCKLNICVPFVSSPNWSYVCLFYLQCKLDMYLLFLPPSWTEHMRTFCLLSKLDLCLPFCFQCKPGICLCFWQFIVIFVLWVLYSALNNPTLSKLTISILSLSQRKLNQFSLK